MAKPTLVNFSPGRILLASFGFVIAVGTVLLSLPQAREVDISFIDILFTATSTTCVTGVHVVPISHFTFFGQCIIFALMQIGGLGLMTLSFFLFSLVLNLGMASKLIAGQLLDFELWGKVKAFLILIIGLTCGIELLGTFLLYIPFSKTLSHSDALFYAAFHSVSAFCNAGISLFENSMTTYNQSPFVLLTLSSLVIAGGIGFIVWYDLFSLIKSFIDRLRGRPRRFIVSLHSKLVLITSGLLLCSGTLIIWFIERSGTLKDLNFADSLINSFFLSTSARSAGFASIDFGQANHATLFILLLFMFIGASPSSTGAGIKTSTFSLLLINLAAIIRNRESVEIFGRTIPAEQIYKVMGIVAVAVMWIITATFILLLTEEGFSFLQIVFETVSTFATCGYSTGITQHLSLYGKTLIMITMILGRIGSLTLVLALRGKREKLLYRYPEERVIIG